MATTNGGQQQRFEAGQQASILPMNTGGYLDTAFGRQCVQGQINMVLYGTTSSRHQWGDGRWYPVPRAIEFSAYRGEDTVFMKDEERLHTNWQR
eukprot:scaffold5449_cov52-Cyclotella_meneghiniana.AAC.3